MSIRTGGWERMSLLLSIKPNPLIKRANNNSDRHFFCFNLDIFLKKVTVTFKKSLLKKNATFKKFVYKATNGAIYIAQARYHYK